MSLEEFKCKLMEAMANSSEDDRYENRVAQMVNDGVLDYEGNPIKCSKCGSRSLTRCDNSNNDNCIGGQCSTEYDVVCNDCGEHLAHWSYGTWKYWEEI